MYNSIRSAPHSSAKSTIEMVGSINKNPLIFFLIEEITSERSRSISDFSNLYLITTSGASGTKVTCSGLISFTILMNLLSG